jgi:hypothetical protein
MSSSGAWRGALGAAALLVAMTIAGAARADQERVGVTAAVNPNAVGHTAPSESRALFVGANVLYKERIVTTDSGQAQILFLDQSALTVAPNSDITIDQFVYDPDKKAGKLAATVSKGILRFVGGRISKQSDVTFNTPTATIGVRGGVLVIHVDPNGVTRATFLFGNHMTVTSGGVTRIVTRPNFSVTVQLPNQPPGSPTPTPQQLLTETLHALEGSTSQSGGASQIPTDTKVALVTLTQNLLNSDPTTFVVTSGTNQSKTFIAPIPDLVQNTQNDANQHTAQQATSTNTTSTQQSDNTNTGTTNTGNTNTGNTGGNNTPTNPNQRTIQSYNLAQDSRSNSNIPFVPRTIGADDANTVVSPLYLVQRSSGAAADGGATDERSTALQASLLFNANGKFAAAIGTFVLGRDGNGAPQLAGGVVGTSGFVGAFQDSEEETELATARASVVSAAGGNFGQTDGSSPAFSLTNSGSGTFFDVEDNDMQSESYTFTHAATQVATSSSVGASRTDRTLQGYAAVVSNVFGTPVIFGNQNGLPTDVTIQTSGSLNRLVAQFNLQSEDPGTIGDLVLNFGGLTGNSQGNFDPSRSAFIDDNIFGARDQRLTNGSQTSTIGGQVVSDANLVMVTSDTVPIPPNSPFLPSGVSICQCQYLKWGYWLGDFTTHDGSVTGAAVIGTWVAGETADLVSFNAQAQGQAIYTGHAIGNVNNNGNQYMAVGKFTNNWDFRSRTGTVTINSFDGISALSGQASAPSDPRNYSGTLAGQHPTAGIVNATIKGTFFKSPTDVAAETGGQFKITNDSGTYKAAGIFAAKR